MLVWHLSFAHHLSKKNNSQLNQTGLPQPMTSTFLSNKTILMFILDIIIDLQYISKLFVDTFKVLFN